MKVSLELRYGREDEEMMGLQFCNEMGLLNLCIHPDKVATARKLKNTIRDATGAIWLKTLKWNCRMAGLDGWMGGSEKANDNPDLRGSRGRIVLNSSQRIFQTSEKCIFHLSVVR